MKCDNKATCTDCQPGFNLVNDNKRCILQSDVDNDLIYFNPNTLLYTPCSELISLCNKCTNELTCTDCGTKGELDINNKCASNELIQNNNYYLDETINRYVSCSINKKCDKINNDEDNLSTGGIIGIAFGCLGFILIIIFLICYLIKRNKKQNEYHGDINVLSEEKIEKKNEQENDGITEPEKAQVKTYKRSIHNV